MPDDGHSVVPVADFQQDTLYPLVAARHDAALVHSPVVLSGLTMDHHWHHPHVERLRNHAVPRMEHHADGTDCEPMVLHHAHLRIPALRFLPFGKPYLTDGPANQSSDASFELPTADHPRQRHHDVVCIPGLYIHLRHHRIHHQETG